MARPDDKIEIDADLTSESTESLPVGFVRPTRRKILGGAAALIVAGLGAGRGVLAHGGEDDDEDGHDNSGPGGGHDNDDDDHHGLPPAQSTQVADVTTVRIVDERFEPNYILIETGQTVTWENHDDDQHTASGRGMDTGVINPGGKGTVTFLESGEFKYTCNFHPEMIGLVTVTGESKATPQATPQASPVAAPMDIDVKIVDFAFDSDQAVVAIGGTVTWTNTGQTPHTILAIWATSDILNPGDTFEHSFDEAGRFEYQCGLHPAMVGTIDVIEATSASPESSPSTPEVA
jgi:plastocyanin